MKPGGVIGDPNLGAVYVVAGSSSSIRGGDLNHSAMFVSFNLLGSVVLDVDGDTLDATFLGVGNNNVLDTFTITKAPVTPTLSVTASIATATEAGPVSGRFTVTRVGDPSVVLTVGYTVSGTATAGSDYAALGGVIELAAGQTSATIDVNPIDDSEIELGETVILSLSANPAYDLGTPENATVTIISDEVPPTVSIVASIATATEAGLTSGSLTVTRSGDPTGALTVNYTVSGTATAGSDYDALGGTLIIAAGQSSATIDVNPIDDTEIERGETVIVSLSSDPDYDIGTLGNATVNIISDEIPPTVSIVAGVATATEAGPASGSFTVTCASGATTEPVTIHYTVGGSATAGSDYVALGGTISLAAGQTSAGIDVNPIDDSEFEPDETVIVTLTADPAYDVGAPSEATVSIVSDDIQPATPVVLGVVSVFDAKNGKTYLPGGPDGSEPMDD